MADTNTDVLGLLLQETGNNNNTWGSLLNTQVIQYIEDKLVGRTAISSTGGTYVATQAELRANFLVVSGTLASNCIIQVLNKKNSWWVVNNTSGSFTLTFKTSGGSASAAIPQGSHALVFCDGSDVCTVGLASTALSGQIGAADGSAGAPTYSFGNDLDSGRWRTGANAFADGVNGAAVVTYSTTGISITGTITASLGLTVTAGGLTVTAGGLTVTAGTVSLPALSIASAALAADSVVTSKILDANVTYAKIQNVANSKFLVRYSSGAGVVQEGSFGSDFSLNSSTGELTLAKTRGMVKLATVSASGGASIDFTSLIDGTYKEYVFILNNVTPGTNGTHLLMRVDTNGGASFETTLYLSEVYQINSGLTANSSGATNGIILTESAIVSSDSSYGICGRVLLTNPAGTTQRKGVVVETSYLRSGGTHGRSFGGGLWNGGNGAINAVQFLMASGTLTGEITMYGNP